MTRYWLTQLALSAVGWAYIILCIGGIALAVWLPEQRRWKWAAGLLALAVAAILPIRGYRELFKEHKQAEAFRQRVAQVREVFDRHCQSAGERIERSVSGVDRVVWMKWRLPTTGETRQFEMDDPYGHDCAGEWCIANLLRLDEGGYPAGHASGPRKGAGYRYVETTDPRDGNKYRYYAQIGTEEDGPSNVGRPVLKRSPIQAYSGRYGITVRSGKGAVGMPPHLLAPNCFTSSGHTHLLRLLPSGLRDTAFVGEIQPGVVFGAKLLFAPMRQGGGKVALGLVQPSVLPSLLQVLDADLRAMTVNSHARFLWGRPSGRRMS